MNLANDSCLQNSNQQHHKHIQETLKTKVYVLLPITSHGASRQRPHRGSGDTFEIFVHPMLSTWMLAGLSKLAKNGGFWGFV